MGSFILVFIGRGADFVCLFFGGGVSKFGVRYKQMFFEGPKFVYHFKVGSKILLNLILKGQGLIFLVIIWWGGQNFFSFLYRESKFLLVFFMGRL